MANFNMNKVILGGRITRDPELKQTQSGIACLKFSIAVNRRVKKDDQNNQPMADFINCTAWRQNAENIAKFFKKGSCIMIVGNIQTGSYEKDGVKRTTTDVMVDEFYFVDGKGENKTDSPAPAQTQTAPAPAEPNLEIAGDNDELPF